MKNQNTQMISKKRWSVLQYLLFSSLLVLAVACNKGGSTGPDVPPDVAEVNGYLEELPNWSEFSPTEPDQSPTATGDAEQLDDETVDVETVDSTGAVVTLQDVTYSCQQQPFTLTENPQQIAMYSPDREILWAGGMVQGKSHRDGIGSLLGLPIAERTPIRVSIPSLANNDNFRLVESPNQAEVDQAIGSMIGGATQSGLSTPSTISFKMETYHSEKQSALQMSISGRYLGFEASASGSIDRKTSEKTITAQFYQKMYEVVVEPPQSPGDFFSDAFTEQRLQQQVNQGRIGPDNLPVYVSNIVYGRMMMFSLTSTASEEDIRATLQAGYNSIGGNVNAELSDQQKGILQNSKIKVTSIGGDADATLAMIESGDWAQYFTENAPLSSASPLSYTFRNLGDGSIASVSETTEYNIKSCTAKRATPGTFEFGEIQSLSLPISTPAKVMMADVDNDNDQDLVWNHLSANKNETVVGFSNGDGTFTMGSPFTHSVSPADGWSQYVVKVGDFDNDGRDDLAWGRVNVTNTTFIGLSNGDGTFEEMPMFTREGSGWRTGYLFDVGDIDGKNGDDLVWNELGGQNRTYVSFSNGDGTYGINNFGETDQKWNDSPNPLSADLYRWRITDFDGDGRDDMLWHREGVTGSNGHIIHFAVSKRDEEGNIFDFPDAFNRESTGWQDYEVVIGNIDGTAGADLVWVQPQYSADRVAVHRDLATGSSPALIQGPLQYVEREGGPYDNHIRLLDVNGDGRKDLLINALESVNHLIIGLGKADGEFDFGRIPQDHPAVDDWSLFKILVGDITGDGRDDIVYNNADVSNDVYVAIAKE